MQVGDGRRRWTALVVVGLVAIAVAILADVLATVFIAVTLGYVLYPLRQSLVRRGLSRRLASVALTVGVVVGAFVLLTPLLVVIYERREIVVVFLQNLPDTVVIGVEGLSVALDSNALVGGVRDELTHLGVRIARRLPVISTKLLLFFFLVYAILLRPGAARDVSLDVVPAPYQEVVDRFDDRTRETLYGLYGVQVATGVVTFLVALPFFFAFGYRAFFSLAVVAGILQLMPIVGPSIVVLALGLFDFAIGNPNRGTLVILTGIVVVGMLPDAVLRPRLASRTAGLPASLYFVGFTGGVLSLGAVGLIAGPLIVALVLEGIDVLTPE